MDHPQAPHGPPAEEGADRPPAEVAEEHVPGATGGPTQSVSITELRIVAAGAARLLWWWPGVVVVLAVYTAVAVALYHHSYPNLWGALSAAGTAVAWYASPMRNFEARRRKRLGQGG